MKRRYNILILVAGMILCGLAAVTVCNALFGCDANKKYITKTWTYGFVRRTGESLSIDYGANHRGQVRIVLFRYLSQGGTEFIDEVRIAASGMPEKYPNGLMVNAIAVDIGEHPDTRVFAASDVVGICELQLPDGDLSYLKSNMQNWTDEDLDSFFKRKVLPVMRRPSRTY